MNLNDMARDIYAANKAKGFWDEGRKFGELLMLVVSELGEACEAHRKGRVASISGYNNYINLGFKYDNGEIIAFEKYIKDTLEDEIADAIIRLFDMAGGLGIDIDTHIKLKLAYNATRPYKHGKAY